jgi:hypothetical protein
MLQIIAFVAPSAGSNYNVHLNDGAQIWRNYDSLSASVLNRIAIYNAAAFIRLAAELTSDEGTHKKTNASQFV